MVVATILAMNGGQTGSAGRRANQSGVGEYDRRSNSRAQALRGRALRNQRNRRARQS